MICTLGQSANRRLGLRNCRVNCNPSKIGFEPISILPTWYASSSRTWKVDRLSFDNDRTIEIETLAVKFCLRPPSVFLWQKDSWHWFHSLILCRKSTTYPLSACLRMSLLAFLLNSIAGSRSASSCLKSLGRMVMRRMRIPAIDFCSRSQLREDLTLQHCVIFLRLRKVTCVESILSSWLFTNTRGT